MRHHLSVVMLLGLLASLAIVRTAGASDTPGTSTPPLDTYVPAGELEGRFTIAGSNTMFPLMTRLASEFRRYYPQVQIGVEGQGSKSVSAGEDSMRRPFWEMVQNKALYRRGDGSDDGHHVSMRVHVMASSRKLSSHEVATFTSRFGYAPMEIPIAREAVAVYVHRDNPLVGLTLDQVDAIFSETCRRTGGPAITQWDQLGLP